MPQSLQYIGLFTAGLRLEPATGLATGLELGLAPAAVPPPPPQPVSIRAQMSTPRLAGNIALRCLMNIQIDGLACFDMLIVYILFVFLIIVF